MRYRFSHWTVDADRFELRRGADPVPVQPKALSLLLYLLEHRALPNARFVVLHLAGE